MNTWIRCILGLALIGGAGYASIHFYDQIPNASEIEAKAIAAIDQATTPSTNELQSWTRDETQHRTTATLTTIGSSNSSVNITWISTEDEDRIFESSPLSGSDLATITHQLRQHSPRSLYFPEPLVIENTDDLTKQILQAEIEDLSQCVLAVDLRRAPSTGEIPSPILRSSLSVDAVQGDTSSLPEINEFDLEPITLGGESTMVGYHSLRLNDDYQHCIIARWGDRFILHSAVLAYAQQLSIPIKDIRLHIGKHLVLGKAVRIPIDHFGRVNAINEKPPHVKAINASDLITKNDGLTDSIQDRLVIIASSKIWNESNSLSIINACLTAPTIIETFSISTLQKQVHFAYLSGITVLFVVFFGMLHKKYHLSLFSLAIATGVMVEMYMLEQIRISLPIVTTLTVLVTSLVARALFLKKTEAPEITSNTESP